MRWFVDVSSVGKGTEKQRYCVDADSWQRALQSARALRDDPGPMTGFSVELLDDGFSAIDPIKRQKYAIHKAPDDADLSPKPGDAPAAAKGAAASSLPAAPDPPAATDGGTARATSRSSRPPAPDLKLSPKGSGKSKGRTPTPPPTKAAPSPKVAAPKPPTQSVAPLHELPVLAQREQNPGPEGPLTYREFAYLAEGQRDQAELEALLRAQLARIQDSIAAAKAGKLVNLALFGAAFAGKPTQRPLATLTWKDWRGEPVIEVAATSMPVGEVAPPAPTLAQEPVEPLVPAMSIVEPSPVRDASAAPPEAPPAVASIPEEPPSLRAIGDPFRIDPLRAPVALRDIVPLSAPPSSEAPATTRAPEIGTATPRKAPPKRLRGDELIADLFESMHDLQFLRDSVEGADFCLTMALEKMPARGGIVHLYDIDRREFVITCAGGTGGEALLRQRSAENDPVLASAMRRRRALVIPDATASESVRSRTRYAALGGATSLVVAPVALGGRFVGAIELLNPIDDVPFTDDDGHALSYIAEQLATFVAAHGIVLEREQAAAPTGRSAQAR